MKKKRIIYVVLAIVVSTPVILLFVRSAMSKKPDNLGVAGGRLADCPDSPNCVSTQAMEAKHQIEPISFDGTSEEAIERLAAALATIPRTKIVTQRADYIHAEATSLVFRFVDDVEFFVNTDEQTIHFRSASRVGYSDLGANRTRMERIRQAFNEKRPNR